jgi:hypothetical protein
VWRMTAFSLFRPYGAARRMRIHTLWIAASLRSSR